MNKFMEKQGKKLALGAAIAMLVAFICNFMTTVLYVLDGSIRRLLIYLSGITVARVITNDVFFGLAILLFAVGAIIYWRKKTGAFMATAGGVVGILQLFIYFIFTLIMAIRFERFSLITGSGILVNGLLLISYLFLIVAGFPKPKKHTLAYIFAGIVAVLILIGIIADVIPVIKELLSTLHMIFFGVSIRLILHELPGFFLPLFDGCSNLLFYIGLLALNFTIIWNKVVPAEVPSVPVSTAEPTEQTTPKPVIQLDMNLFDE